MRTIKKALSIVLAGVMTVGGMSVFSVSAAQTSTPTLSFKTQNALYAHAVSGSTILTHGLHGNVNTTRIWRN